MDHAGNSSWHKKQKIKLRSEKKKSTRLLLHLKNARDYWGSDTVHMNSSTATSKDAQDKLDPVPRWVSVPQDGDVHTTGPPQEGGRPKAVWKVSLP